MSERLLSSEELFELHKEKVKKSLQEVKRRSRKPNLYDRVAIPVDRLIGRTLARVYGIPQEET